MKKMIQKVVKRASPKRVLDKYSDRQTIQRFGEKFGLVYFGHVSSQNEDYRMVRGLTLSTKHRDAHYCIGSYNNYDVVFVERYDTVVNLKQKTRRAHRWHIMQFDLRTTTELPHLFVGLHTHSEAFYLQLFTKFPELRSLRIGHLGSHRPEFLAKYRIYGPPAKIIDIERLLTPEITEMITAHFGALAIEIHDGSLYIYSEKLRVSESLLEGMLKNGVWLAQHIDAVSSQKV